MSAAVSGALPRARGPALESQVGVEEVTHRGDAILVETSLDAVRERIGDPHQAGLVLAREATGEFAAARRAAELVIPRGESSRRARRPREVVACAATSPSAASNSSRPRRGASARVLSFTGSVTGAGAYGTPTRRVASAGRGRTSGAPRQRTVGPGSVKRGARRPTRLPFPERRCRAGHRRPGAHDVGPLSITMSHSLPGRASRPARSRGPGPDPNNGAVVTLSTSRAPTPEAPAVPSPGRYSRTTNPTRTALEENLASLEGGAWGLCFASGLASTNALMDRLVPGDHVVCGNDLYGGTYRIFTKVFERYGIGFSFVDTTQPGAIAEAMTPATKYVYIETPSNPLLNLTDIARPRRRPRGRCTLVVDNTFATPYLQSPRAGR